MQGTESVLIRVDQWEERGLKKSGCHPLLSSVSSGVNGPLAQLAEQQTLNLRVEGSIPSRLTILRYLTTPSLTEEAPTAKVAELVYALDLGSSPERSGWGFESPLSHQDPERMTLR